MGNAQLSPPDSEKIIEPDLLAGVAGIGLTCLVGAFTEFDPIFHRSEHYAAQDRISALNAGIKEEQDAIHVLRSTDGAEAGPIIKIIDGKIAATRGEVQAIAEHAPPYGALQQVEGEALIVGEAIPIAILFALGARALRCAVFKPPVTEATQG